MVSTRRSRKQSNTTDIVKTEYDDSQTVHMKSEVIQDANENKNKNKNGHKSVQSKLDQNWGASSCKAEQMPPVNPYEEMVKAKRKRNQEMLSQLGLLEASAQLRTTMHPNSGHKRTEASQRGLRADRKRRNDDRPEPPRRKSSRIAGVKADGMYIEEERAGGKYVIGGVGASDNTSQLASSDKVHVQENTKHFFNGRVNDGSDLSIKDAVELADFKYVKEHSATSAQKFLDEIKESFGECGGMSPKSTVDSLASQVDNLKVDGPECVAKVVPDRIYSVAFHPSAHKMLAVAGDKQGNIGFWDVDADASLSGDESSKNNTDGVHLFKPHGRPVSNLEWNSSGDKMYSASYDGTVRLFDINQQTFAEVFATYDDSDEFKGKLGHGIDEGRKFWTQYTCLDHRNDNCLFVTTSLGGLIHVDLRGKSKITFDLTLSDKKINTVSLHPNEHIVATTGLDCEVNLWDIRKFSSKSKKLTPIATQRSSKSINSAFFSPSGKYLLTTTMSNTLDVIENGHLQTGLIENPDRRIRHDNKTGRWLTTFMAQWHPSPKTNEELFVVGSMAKPRRMEFFDADSGSLLRGVSGASLTAVVSRCCFHPSSNQLIAMGGNSSGRVTIFR